MVFCSYFSLKIEVSFRITTKNMEETFRISHELGRHLNNGDRTDNSLLGNALKINIFHIGKKILLISCRTDDLTDV